jgi:hypothetical protein
LELDNAAQTADVSVNSLAPGEATDISWNFNEGLPTGNHFVYCYFDSKGVIG